MYPILKVSLITTVKNEENSIITFLLSIANQTVQPNEIIIVDGLSTDRTASLIKGFGKLQIKLIQEKSNIAHGRNIAISNTIHDIIAVTDGGCSLKEDWLENIIKPFSEGVDVVVGNYTYKVNSFFDACLYSIHGLFKDGKDLNAFVISSRSLAFNKKVWEEIGGYPEWLDFSEDMYFHNRIQERNFKITFAHDAVVEWRMQVNLKGLFKQFFHYMEGDGMAGMHTRRHILRFSSYVGSVFLLGLSMKISLYFLVPLIVGAISYLIPPFLKFSRLGMYRLWGKALVAIPLVLAFIDVAKMAGYLSGLTKRMKGLKLKA